MWKGSGREMLDVSHLVTDRGIDCKIWVSKTQRRIGFIKRVTFTCQITD